MINKSLLEFATLSTKELISSCVLSIDDQFWTEFINRFDQWIRKYIKKINNLWQKAQTCYLVEDIDDLVQNVYLKLLDNGKKALQSFDGNKDSSFFAYLSAIAINVTKKTLRKYLAVKRQAQIISIEEVCE